MRVFLPALATLMASCLTFGQQAQQQTQQPQQPRERNKFIVELEKQIAGKDSLPAEQVFKSIETFKGRPAANVLRTMEFVITPALGVECNHCHVEGKWESDEKAPKLTARKMFKMVGEVSKLLKENVGEKQFATCYMCHHGSAEPVKGVGGGRGARREAPRQ